MEYRFETVDIHALIERASEICRGQIEGKGHHLTIDLAAEEHHVRGDPSRLQQVLWNLIGNAAKYTPEGGRVAIRTHSYGPGACPSRSPTMVSASNPTTSRTCSMPSSGATGRRPPMRPDWGWA